VRPGDAEQQAAAKILRLAKLRPQLAIILGSGFDCCAESVQAKVRIPYSELPGFPRVSAAGHKGELIVGHIGKQPVIMLRGRAHFYEGHSMSAVTFAVRALARCGIEALLLTNASGAISPRLEVGNFMLVKDHINFMGENPLQGATVRNQDRFVDLTQVYDPGLQHTLSRAAKACRLRLKTGVYLAVSGPSFETPAEIRAFAKWGVHAVGMSTVPEAMVARQLGIRVAAVSCIANLAAGRSKRPISHSEVIETVGRMSEAARAFIEEFVGFYGRSSELSH